MKRYYTIDMHSIPLHQTGRLLLVLCLTMLIAIGCGGAGDAGKGTNGMIPTVEAVQARYGKLPLSQRLSGRVEGRNQIGVYPELSAVIVDVQAKDGDTVEKGDVLIRLRDKEFRERFNQAVSGHEIAKAQLKQAEARFAEANAELNRMQSLADQGMASPSELETAQTRSLTAEADVALAEARLNQAASTVEERRETLSQTEIRAPISGSVGSRNAEVGMLVNGNTRLFTLGQLDAVRVEVVLTDRMLTFVRTGQRCEIFPAHEQAEPIQAHISRISPFLNPLSHSTEAEIDVPNPDGRLVPGMFVTVDIFFGESAEATVVPLSALYEHPATGVTGVYASSESLSIPASVLSGDKPGAALSDPVPFQFIPVDIIARGRMEAGIEGVEPDQWVITLGQNLLAGEDGKARVKRVDWDWITRLQNLQREDLMDEVIRNQDKKDRAGSAGQ